MSNLTITGAIVAIVGIILVYGTAYLIAKVHALGDLVKEKTQGMTFGETVAHIVDTVETLVDNAKQTIIADYQQKSADGTVTVQEFEQIVQDVLTNVLSTIGPGMEDILNQFIADYESWVKAHVTKAVSKVVNIKK